MRARVVPFNGDDLSVRGRCPSWVGAEVEILNAAYDSSGLYFMVQHKKPEGPGWKFEATLHELEPLDECAATLLAAARLNPLLVLGGGE